MAKVNLVECGMDDLLFVLAGAIAGGGFVAAGNLLRHKIAVVVVDDHMARKRLAGQQHDHAWGIDGKQDGAVWVRCGICGKRKPQSGVR